MLHALRKNTRIFKQHWLFYVILLLITELTDQLLLFPLFRLCTTYLLQACAIPFDSLRNIITIITTKTLPFLALVVEFCVILIILYFQFCIIFLMTQRIANHNLTVKNIQIDLHITFGSISLFSLYILLLLPVLEIVFRTEFLAKIKIAEFIISHVEISLYFGLFLLILYALLLYFGSRLVTTLPNFLLKRLSFREAIKNSWHSDNKLIVAQVWKLIGISCLIMLLFDSLVYGVQVIADLFPGKYFLANLNLLLLQSGNEVGLGWLLFNLFALVAPTDYQSQAKKHHYSKQLKLIIMLVLILFSSVAIFNNRLYLKQNIRIPVLISHRGVNDKNGVQNTVEALRKTAKLKPDYVEIDLHETKDHHIVVMHDENLRELTNVNQPPTALTLKQVTKLTARENNHRARVASFAHYYAVARQLHQKLLIEIKTTPQDSKNFVNSFVKTYGKQIIKNRDQVQSLDYRVVRKIHSLAPQIKVFYLEPYNLAYPRAKADGYAVEYASLTSNFIWQVHQQHKMLYAWTVNRRTALRKMADAHVDGIITDRVNVARQTLRQYKHQNTLAKKILHYIIIF